MGLPQNYGPYGGFTPKTSHLSDFRIIFGRLPMLFKQNPYQLRPVKPFPLHLPLLHSELGVLQRDPDRRPDDAYMQGIRS